MKFILGNFVLFGAILCTSATYYGGGGYGTKSIQAPAYQAPAYQAPAYQAPKSPSYAPAPTYQRQAPKSPSYSLLKSYPSQQRQEVVPAAVEQLSHTVEYRVMPYQQQAIKPQVIEVESSDIPIHLHFKTRSSTLSLTQSHQKAPALAPQYSSVEDEPARLLTEIKKPVIQEVREVVTPYRQVTQEIKPVVESLHTVVSKGPNTAAAAAAPAYEPAPAPAASAYAPPAPVPVAPAPKNEYKPAARQMKQAAYRKPAATVATAPKVNRPVVLKKSSSYARGPAPAPAPVANYGGQSY